MKKQTSALLAALAVFTSTALADQSQTASQPTVLWEADWIGCAEARKENAPVFYARKVFEAPDGAAAADLHLSAHLQFRAYLNGERIGDGPARNIIPSIYYSTFDLKALLKPGKNVLVVETYTHASQAKQTAMIAQLEFRDAQGRALSTLVSDESWQVRPAPYAPILFRGSGWTMPENFNAMGAPTDLHAVNARPAGWAAAIIQPGSKEAVTRSNVGPRWCDNPQEPLFSDMRFNAEVRHETRDPAMWAYFSDANVIPPFTEFPFQSLEPSPVPNFEREEAWPKKVVSVGEVIETLGSVRTMNALAMAVEIPQPLDQCNVDNVEGLLKPEGGPMTVRSNFDFHDMKALYTWWDKHEEGMPGLRNVTVILDFGELMDAHIALDLEGSGGDTVDICWGQLLVDGRPRSFLFNSAWPEKKGQLSQMFTKRYILRPGRQQWECFHFENFRYLQLTFRYLRGPLKVHKIAAVKTELPMARRGAFRCSDPFLEKLFEANERTLLLASGDTFNDNNIREKNAWFGDISEGSVYSCLPIFGDAPMLRHFMNLKLKSQTDDGDVPMYAGGRTPSNLPAHGMRAAAVLAEYGLWCEDTDAFRRLALPFLERYFVFLAETEKENGFFRSDRPERDWVDHAPRKATDDPIPANLICAILHDKVADLFDAYGHRPDLAAQYRDRADRIRTTVRDGFWDESRQLYMDGKKDGQPCGSYSEHANYLALAAGLGGDGRREAILGAFSDPARIGEITECTPSFMFWPLYALYTIGEGEGGIDLLGRNKRFFREGIDTLQECWSVFTTRHTWAPVGLSTCQNGAGSPVWFMTTGILGVKPLKPGFAEFEVAPQPGKLEWAEGIVPSPKGDIPVAWKIEGGKFVLDLTVPEGTTARVRLPGETNVRTLAPGKHRVE